jgi:hypothetical protein
MRSSWKRSSPALLAALAGLLSSPSLGHAYPITSFEPNAPTTLTLSDGRRIEGRYRGTLGSATGAPYAERYAAWLDEVGPTSAPALGETLLVTRASGELLRGVFRGFADGDLLLATGDNSFLLVETLHGNNVRRTDEPSMNSDWIAAHKQWKSAPAPYADIVQTDDAMLAVLGASIAMSSATPDGGFTRKGGSDGGGSGGAVAAGVILGVLIGGLLAYAVVGAAVGAAFASAFSHLLI